MRLAFMGTPAFSVPALVELLAAGHEVVAVYTQPPRPAGRGQRLTRSPVHDMADSLGIAVRHPENFRDPADREGFAALDLDAAIVVAYGLILPPAVLEAPRFGCLNLHASLLPRWRGAAPIQRAIMAGDAETGMMVMKMDKGLDTGDIALEDRMPIGEDMTAGELHDALSQLCADLMVRAMAALERGSLTLTPQPEEGVVYAAKIDKAEARVDWSRSARDVHNHIRGLSPFPGAWCETELAGKWERVKLLRSHLSDGIAGAPGEVTAKDGRLFVACGGGAVELVTLQKAGGKPLAAADFLRGAAVTAVR